MKKIVFITRHDPTKIGGGAFATRAYLEALSCIYPKRVVLFVADSYQSNVLKYPPYEIVKVPPRPLYQSIPGIFLGKLTRFEKVFTNWMKENGTSVSKVVFDGGIIGGTFISAIKKYACETITIHHNYEYEYQKENKSIESLKGKFLYWIQKFEKRAFVHSDINLFLTQPDLNLFVEKFGDNKSKKSVLSCIL